jgi:acetyl esterase
MMPHPQIQAMLTAAAAAGLPAFSDLTPAGARELLAQMMSARPAVPLPDLAKVADFSIPGPGGKLTVRHFLPRETPVRGTLLYLHGGGWVLGTPDTSDPLCRVLTHRSGCEIYSVDYRLAPEFPFPAPLDDATAALAWAASRTNGPLFIGGDSAGGNLAAACALRARDLGGPPLAGQLLIYPVTDHDFTTGSYRAHGENRMMLSTRDMQWFWQHYVADVQRRNDPLASPLRARHLGGLAPALIIVAGFDPLCDEGEAYAARLKADGTPVELRRYDDMIHGFLGLFGVADTANEAADAAGQWLRDRT